MAKGGVATPDCIPRIIGLLLMSIHVITLFGWRHVYVALVHG